MSRLQAKILWLYGQVAGSSSISRARVCELVEVDDADLPGVIEAIDATGIVRVILLQSSVRLVSKEVDIAARVREVFEHWTAVRGGRKGIKLTQDRRRKVAARLREGYTVEDLKEAVDGMMASDFHKSKGFQDLIHACKSGERVDHFRAMRPKGNKGGGKHIYSHLPDFTGKG